ncbi:23727_t:CDS:2, partial [Dentiscutata erythropus]
PEALNNQSLEPKALDDQDIELEVLAAYDSTNELYDIEIDKWEKLLQDYSQSSNYLMRSLGYCTKSWAHVFTSRYFTAGAQSTSRNEGKNSTLKCLFGGSSLSLYELFEALEERNKKEIDYCKFVSWKQTIPQIGPKNGSKAIFKPVVDLEAIFSKERKSYRYTCRHFYHIMTLTPNARFHIGLVNRRWYKDMLQETDITNYKFIVISSTIFILTSKVHTLPTQFLYSEFNINGAANRVSNQSHDEISKAISKKRKFGEFWRLGKKIMVNAIEDSNEEIYHELLSFFTSIQNKTSPQIVNSEASDVGKFSYKINNNGHIIGIRNPVKKRSKGHPKLKRIANAFEKSDTKTSYKCKLCNKKGHNSKTCKEKRKSNINTNNKIERLSVFDIPILITKAFVNLGYEELSTTSTSHESIQDISDTEEFIELSNPVVLISSPTQPIDFQNCEHMQRQCSVCHGKGHNSRTCPNKI